ncbi:MAG: FG-GAP-like repeat-containing protein [Bacteroidota bacterium]
MRFLLQITLSSLLLISLTATSTVGQVAINATGTVPDSSAMLDISSTDKGILIPRMSSAERQAIGNGSPATSLLVFDTTTNSFWFYAGTSWQELNSGHTSKLADEDKDTQIQVEKSPDEDIIRFDVSHQQLMQLSFSDTTTFQKYTIDNGFSSPEEVLAVDLDLDGDVDVLSISSTGVDQVAWWENDGSQHFDKHVISTALQDPLDFDVADIDADGDLDVLVGTETSGEVIWWENDGHQNFTRRSVANLSFTSSVAALDMDEDGDTDLLSGTFTGAIFWWENDGDENFTRWTIIDDLGAVRRISAEDVDRDGDSDIVVVTSTNNEIAWFENDGQQNFTKQLVTDTFSGAWAVYATDLDKDDDIDLLGASIEQGGVVWFENDGSQNFTQSTVDNTVGPVYDVSAVDLDSDGKLDIVGTAVQNSDILWWKNDGLQNFSKVTIDDDFTSASAIHPADIDSDGHPDILSASFLTGSIAWWENESTGTLHLAAEVGIGTDSPQSALEVVGTITATAFHGDGSALTGIPGDDLGNHTATQTLDLANNHLINGGTITATAFSGDGSALTGIAGDDLGSHTATQALDLANNHLINGDTITATAFSGDGSALTGITGDDLGNHTATQALDLANNNLTNGGTITATAFSGDGSTLTGIAGDDLGNHTATQVLDLANNHLSNADTVTAVAFVGDGAALTNLSTPFTSANGLTQSTSDEDDFVFGADSLNYGGGLEYKVFFDRSKGAFRAGRISSTNWDEGNIGDYSVAIGSNAIASGNSSTAFGKGESTGTSSFSTGLAKASGDYSAAVGVGEASGSYALAYGILNVAGGNYSLAGGANSNATGNFATAIGSTLTASGSVSTTIGYNLEAPSFGEFVIGVNSTNYTPANTLAIDPTDRLFTVGNGANDTDRSDALKIYKSGITKFAGTASLSNNYVFTIENTTNENTVRNDGLKIVAGHDTFNSFRNRFIRFTTPSGTLCGEITQESNNSVNYGTTSDLRLKENIRPTRYGLTAVLDIQVSDYNYKNEPEEQVKTGFLAQQLYHIYPIAVSPGGEDENIDPWTVDYSKLTPLLVKGMQEQQAIIDELKRKNERLERQLLTLETQVSQITTVLQQQNQ